MPSSEIKFTMRVSASKLPLKKGDKKLKLELDFVPEFSDELTRSNTFFNAKYVQEILQFTSEEVIPKVIEFLYYDRQAEREFQPKNYQKVIAIYDKRKGKGPKGKTLEEAAVKGYVNDYFNDPGRRVKPTEENVTRITYEQLSEPKMTVDVKQIVNGDKDLPR